MFFGRRMKTHSSTLISLFLLLSVFLTVSLTSCENIIQNNDNATEEKKVELKQPYSPDKGYVKLSISQEQNKVRTILPEINTNTLTDLTLTGTKDGAFFTFGNWSSVNELTNETITLDLGTWEFNLKAKQSNGKTFTGSANVEVEVGKLKTVNFVLSATNNQGTCAICRKRSSRKQQARP